MHNQKDAAYNSIISVLKNSLTEPAHYISKRKKFSLALHHKLKKGREGGRELRKGRGIKSFLKNKL